MKINLLIASFFLSLLIGQIAQAQNEISQDSVSINARLAELENKKTRDIKSVKRNLKYTIKVINNQLKNNEITQEKADELKEAAAAKAALDIKYFTQNADLEADYIRKHKKFSDEGNVLLILNNNSIIGVETEKRKYKKELRTSSGLTLGFGYNFINGDNLGINDFSYAKNGYSSIGYQFKTRLDDKNHFRLMYGVEFQTQQTELNGNRVFTQGDNTQTIDIGFDVKYAVFRQNQLVFPLHLEIGGSDRKDFEDGRVRYQEYNKWKFGIGGFVGFNMDSRTKLKYELDGRTVKDITVNNFDNNVFLYGLDAYVGYDNVVLFGRMNLNNVFKSNAIDGQYVSLGIRLQN
ncbi:MAG: hypothetical protein ACSHWW_09840 [Nonlabens sp.]|uniref:hypothetical protein n=1 Tax=Nonlabens sp. TaxID=1888209 RepID=UPI003EF27B9E